MSQKSIQIIHLIDAWFLNFKSLWDYLHNM